MNLIGFHQLENETLLADISEVNENLIHIVEQITYQMVSAAHIKYF